MMMQMFVRRSVTRKWVVPVVAALILALTVGTAAYAAPADRPVVSGAGYWYTVQPGDSWSNLSARTGIAIATLQAANPAHVHPPYNWLYVGHKLWIPTGGSPPAPPSCGYNYTVQYGDSWSRISANTGISVAALQAANPSKVRPPDYWLYAGEVIYIPCGEPAPSVCQYYYTVQPGDSWYGISAQTGVPVSLLQAANPTKLHPPYNWLYVGEVLCIPDP